MDRSVSAVHSRAEIGVLAVAYYGHAYALRMLFVIDRQSKNRIYYVNTALQVS